MVLVGRDTARLREVVEGAEVVTGDLGDAELGERLVETATAAHGHLDGVVNAAGVAAFGSLVDTPDAVVEELFLTNVVGPLFLARRVVPALAERRGFLVNISAVLAEQPMAGMAAYSATKAALTAADRALVRELRRTGVDVIDVRPPHTETGLVGRGPVRGGAPPAAGAGAVGGRRGRPRRGRGGASRAGGRGLLLSGGPPSTIGPGRPSVGGWPPGFLVWGSPVRKEASVRAQEVRRSTRGA